ncbi:MAG: serine/threonine protein kinase [Phycisphaerae bacterium]|nr:serine/threonine protein kinase [Phycisphaerae bacterium]
MENPQRQKLEEIFDAALKKATIVERDAYVDGACGNDAVLRASVEALLRAHAEASQFLEAPLLDPEATIQSPVAGERPGTKISHYKILQQIGEGGFGIVYMAEQEEPVRRKVALKIIKLGMDTKQVIARFEAERQALALMDHPNIARVFDAGATETGRPYFVMELVRGVPITEYCDQHRLSTRERLKLFLLVCSAIQHAHQKGIIHRDIKPNNVLVTLHDSRPVPKVIDFGIAKATSQRLTEKTLFTEFRQFIGTPEYMSPDQAEISGLDVDTRTDIYSLGVLLYELLTGSTPFDSSTLRKAAYEEIQRIIREEIPPLPSTRAATLVATDHDIANRRSVEPSVLSKLIRGDLDWIVMKAMEKDRTRRYDTANELADDVERFLNHEPVLARPPSTIYRLRKFVQRYKFGVSVGLVATLVLVLGFAAATIGFVEATDAKRELRIERDAAESARHQAELARAGEQSQRQAAEAHARSAREEAAKSVAVSRFLQDMLATVDPERSRGREVTVRSILDEAGTQLDRGVLTDQPDVEASIRATIGRTYEALGFFEAAERHLRVAAAIDSDTHGENAAETLRVRSVLAGLLRSRGRFVEAEQLFREVLTSQLRLLGGEHPDTLATLTGLAIALWRQGKYDEAEMIHRRTLDTQRRVLGPDHVETLRSAINLGTVLQAQRELDEAEEVLREALTRCRKLLGDEHPETLTALNNLGLVLEARRKRAEAEALFREAFDRDRRVLGDSHPNTRIALNNLLRMLRSQSKWSETRPFVELQIAEYKNRAMAPDADPKAINDCAWLLLNCSPTDLRDVASALSLARRAVRLDDGKTCDYLDTLALAHYSNGDLDRAIETQRRAVACAREIDAPNCGDLERRLISYLWENGNSVEATRVMGNTLARRLPAASEQDEAVGSILLLQGQILLEQGEYAQAEPLLRECLALRQRVLPPDHWRTGRVMTRLGAVLIGLERFTEAEPLMLQGYAMMEAAADTPTEYTQEAIRSIIGLYEAWGRPEQTAEWRKLIEDTEKAAGDGD